MFCCLRAPPPAQDERIVFNSSGDAQRNQAQSSSVSGELSKASGLPELVTSVRSEDQIKASLVGVNDGGVESRVPAHPTNGRAEPEPQSQRIWAGLVESVRNNAGKSSLGLGSAGEARNGFVALRLPGAGVVPLSDIINQIDGICDPVALLTFERASKRQVRAQRISPNLIIDINMEALSAGGVVSSARLPYPSTDQHPLDGFGLRPRQDILHQLQKNYYNAEAIRLEVHHINAPLQSLLRCQGASEYETLLAELLSTEHLMRAALHDCCLCMLEGVTAASTQLMVHHPIPGTASRVVMPVLLQPLLVWCNAPLASDTPELSFMAVVVRYTFSAGLHDALQQLHRIYTMLSSLSGIVTLFTLRGRVLHQNTASVRYMGLRTDVGQDGTVAAAAANASTGSTAGNNVSPDLVDASGLALGSLLRQIFALSSEQLDDMLEEVAEGKTWKGIVPVPSLLTPTTDPGPAQVAALLAQGGSSMTVTVATPNQSHVQMMSTWEHLGPVLMSTQPDCRSSHAQHGDQSDVEVHSDLVGAFMIMRDKCAHGPSETAPGIGTRATGPPKDTVSWPEGSEMAVQEAVPPSGGSTHGGTAAGGIKLSAGETGSTTPDSSIMLAIGSTYGSQLATQNSSLRVAGRQRSLISRVTSTDLPEIGAQAVGEYSPNNNSINGTLGLVHGPSSLYSKLSGSAPVVPVPSRAQSSARNGTPPLLRTLMENGSSIVGAGDRTSCNLDFMPVGPGLVPKNLRNELQQLGLTDAVRRSIVRRRSALKLAPSTTDDNPLSTSTWGLFDTSRNRIESKSFTLRNNNSATMAVGGSGTPVRRLGTDRQLERANPIPSEPQTTAATSSINSTNSGSVKKRSSSRLMSFLASKNFGGAPPVAGACVSSGRSFTLGLVNNKTSPSQLCDSRGGSGVTSNGMRHCTTEPDGTLSAPDVELGSRQGRGGSSPLTLPHLNSYSSMPCSANSGLARGGSVGCTPLTVPAPVVPNSSASPISRHPPRRLRPAIEDVAEESGAEVSSARLPALISTARDSSSSPLAPIAPLSAAMHSYRLSTLSQVNSSRTPTAGQLTQPSNPGPVRGHSATDEDEEDCWHEITASTLRDPVSGEQALLVMQVDVSARVRAERRIAEVLEAEHKLLESVFPRHVLELAAIRHADSRPGMKPQDKFSLAELPLVRNCASVATYHPMVTILFSDIIGFTDMCQEIPATKVMEFLNNLYSRLDTLLDVYGVYKVETIGDCYMVAGGLMTRDEDGFMTVRDSDRTDELHAAKVMSFAKAMLRELSDVLLPTTGEPMQMRIGLHSGPVMSGIVGSKMPRFCLFGDTVNTASRMESTCPPGYIHVSGVTREILQDENWEAMGGVMVKGKGMMETFCWVPPEHELCLQRRAAAGSQRPTRPRRASSIVYINGGGGNSAGGATLSRDGSGTLNLVQQLAQGANVGNSGRGSANCSTSIPSVTASANNLQPGGRQEQVSAAEEASTFPPPPRGLRAFSAQFTSPRSMTTSEAEGGESTGSLMGSAARATSAFVPYVHVRNNGPNMRRKPHRTCSTTALAYKGMARPM